MGARMRLFVVGSQCAERSGAPRAHLACHGEVSERSRARCGGTAWGWCLARRTAAGDYDTTTNGTMAGFTRTGPRRRADPWSERSGTG